MSSFDGQDLFGSGSVQILVQPMDVATKLSGFVGADGVLHSGLGSRGRGLTITGVLKGASAAALRILIEAIEDYMVDADDDGPFDLIDDFAVTYENVMLLAMRINTPIMRTGDSEYRIEYSITGRQLYT